MNNKRNITPSLPETTFYKAVVDEEGRFRGLVMASSMEEIIVKTKDYSTVGEIFTAQKGWSKRGKK